MKILMISGDRSLAAGKRGAFYYMLEEFHKYWERVDIVCPEFHTKTQKHKNTVFFDNVYIHPSDFGVLRQPWFIKKKGVELCKKHKYDLITVHEYPPFYNGIGARWLYNKIKTPYVIEFHHIVGYPKAADFKEGFYRFLYKIFVKYVCAKAKVARVVNQKQTREFLTNLGVDAGKIKNISSQYIDLDVFRPMDVDKKYDLVFAGRLVKNKNVKMLIEAVEIVRCKMPEVRCAIIGDGSEMDNLKSKVKSFKLERNIKFLGWLPTVEDVAKVYNQSKLFVMPSLNEGGPRVCLEAMACGLPVVTTRVGIMLDIIDDGVNGFFCDWSAEDLAEKILEIEKLEIKKLRDESRKTARQFERKEMIRRLAETYQKIVAS